MTTESLLPVDDVARLRTSFDQAKRHGQSNWWGTEEHQILFDRIAELTALGNELADCLAGEILWGDQPDRLRSGHPLRRWREAKR